MSFLVNKDLVKTSPKDWSDLLKPEYAGQVALAGDPRASNQAFSVFSRPAWPAAQKLARTPAKPV